MAAMRELDAAGIVVQDLGLRRPTLDDVFLSLTGHAAELETDPSTPEQDKTAKGSDTTQDKEVAAR